MVVVRSGSPAPAPPGWPASASRRAVAQSRASRGFTVSLIISAPPIRANRPAVQTPGYRNDKWLDALLKVKADELHNHISTP